MGASFSSPVQTVSGAHPTSYTIGAGSSPGVKRPGRGVDHPPHLALRLKKKWSYTSTPPLDLRGLLQGEFYLHLYHCTAISRRGRFTCTSRRKLTVIHKDCGRFYWCGLYKSLEVVLILDVQAPVISE